MAYLVLNFVNEIDNVSCQVGDMAYHITTSIQQAHTVGNTVVELGEITHIINAPNSPVTPTYKIVIDQVSPFNPDPNPNNFIMFGKNAIANTTGLSGYYLEANFTNSSIEKATLFSVGSEISISSK